MGKIIQYLYFACVCACGLSFASCSSSENELDEPQVILSTIAGTWLEYAYLCSDGYFVDISNTGYNLYYEFAIPNQFTQYTIGENGTKEVESKGIWTYSAETQKIHVEEERGWNLDITVSFSNDAKDGYKATFDIKGRTPTQSTTIKVKKIE